jgi:hypothetical protein
MSEESTLKVTKDERARLRALAELATPGPWKVCGADGCPRQDIWSTSVDAEVASASAENECGEGLNRVTQRHNAAFVAASREAIPGLLDALDAADLRTSRALGLIEDADAGSGFGSGPAFRRALRHVLSGGDL